MSNYSSQREIVDVMDNPGPETLLRGDCSLRLQRQLGYTVTATRDRNSYSSKCIPRFGSARRLSSVFRTLLSGRTTMTGTGE